MHSVWLMSTPETAHPPPLLSLTDSLSLYGTPPPHPTAPTYACGFCLLEVPCICVPFPDCHHITSLPHCMQEPELKFTVQRAADGENSAMNGTAMNGTAYHQVYPSGCETLLVAFYGTVLPIWVSETSIPLSSMKMHPHPPTHTHNTQN